MTIFYVGVGLYLIFSENLSHIDSFIRYLMGGTFVFYGTYRLYRLIVKIKDEFFPEKYDED